jgi:hypothetical protein
MGVHFPPQAWGIATIDDLQAPVVESCHIHVANHLWVVLVSLLVILFSTRVAMSSTRYSPSPKLHPAGRAEYPRSKPDLKA